MRRYVNDATKGTLKAIDLGNSIGAGTFASEVGGWRTGTAWPSASRTLTFLTTGIHDYETYGSSLDPSFYVGYRSQARCQVLRSAPRSERWAALPCARYSSSFGVKSHASGGPLCAPRTGQDLTPIS